MVTICHLKIRVFFQLLKEVAFEGVVSLFSSIGQVLFASKHFFSLTVTSLFLAGKTPELAAE